jgi:hypothetical protein
LFPGGAGKRERSTLRQLLHSDDERALGALRAIWDLQGEFQDEDYSEESLHARLKQTLPSAQTLLDAIAAYEDFCRGLQDAFDLIRASAAGQDARGFEVSSIGHDPDFVRSLERLVDRYELARRRLGDVDLQKTASLFDDHFSRFAEPMSTAESAVLLCEHHETVQKRKSAEGKRAWFDRLAPDRIYMRHRYREPRRDIAPNRYIHDYRGKPIRNFYFDL